VRKTQGQIIDANYNNPEKLKLK